MPPRMVKMPEEATTKNTKNTKVFLGLARQIWRAVYPVEDHAFVRPPSWTDEYRRIFELFERTLPARVPLQPDLTP